MALRADTVIERIIFLIKILPFVALVSLINSRVADVYFIFLPSLERFTRSNGDPYICAS
jgi:hypothetical protein